MDTATPPRGVQYWIHLIEEGAGRAWVRRLIFFQLAVIVVGGYHINGAKNFTAAEAMDQAQLARNIADGAGYTTRVIRPISLHLQSPRATASGLDPRSLVGARHPDIVNPPVYPVLLAGMMKALPASVRHGMDSGPRSRPPAEVAIGVFNLGLFALAAGMLFILGRRFGPGIGLLATLAFCGAKSYWEFVFSGLPTLLLVSMFLGTVWLAMDIEAEEGGPAPSPGRRGRLYLRATALGALLGLTCLTVYSAGLLVLPFGLCLWLWCRPRRRLAAVALLAAGFLVVTGPWVGRTWYRSGLPFGAATLAPLASTATFPEARLERSQSPDLRTFPYKEVWTKAKLNTMDILRNEVPMLGGSLFSSLFFVTLILPYGDARLNRLRWLLLAVLATLVPTQAVVRTHLSSLSPGLNAENLLAWFAPAGFLFAAAMFRRVMNFFEFPFPLARMLTQAGAIGLCSLPLLVSLLPPRPPVMASPPYYVPAIRQLCGYLPQGSLVTSDMPWAVSWYCGLECVSLPLRVGQEPREDFFRIHDFQRPFAAMLLTPLTCDVPWRSELLSGEDAVWGRFYMDFILRSQNIPSGFPLKYAFGDGYPYAGYLFLADRPYWREPGR